MVKKHYMLGSPLILRASWQAIALMLLMTLTSSAADKKPTARLLDRVPFDRITLNAANGSKTIDINLLGNRTVPTPLPESGVLELRRLSDPSVLYKVSWNSIARVELYENLLLLEAVKLTNAGDMNQAYEYLDFLHKNYARLSNLDRATTKYIWQDAKVAYQKKNYEESLTILAALYDLNPKHRGLTKFVETVSHLMIKNSLSARDFDAARGVLDLIEQNFPKLKLVNLSSWRAKFEKGAAKQLTLARKSLDAGDFAKARQALRQATAILPNAASANKMLDEIARKSPQIVVGVDQLVPPTADRAPSSLLEWSTARITQLTQPKLLNLIGFSSDGGEYDSPWGELTSDDSGLELEFKLNQAALQQGITADGLALELIRQADPAEPQYRADYAGLLNRVEISSGNLVHISWLRSHVRPEALLPLALQKLTRTRHAPGAYVPKINPKAPLQITYQLPKNATQSGKQKAIVEKFYDREELAYAALLSGDLDVLARIPPWQISPMQKADHIKVSPYRLPTIHVLLINYQRPLLARREFRRALCYAINRPQILNEILLAGKKRAGFNVLSAPIPTGSNIADPVGYAYNQALRPRPYEPRLATVLATVARTSLAKKAAAKARAEQIVKDKAAGLTDEEIKAAAAKAKAAQANKKPPKLPPAQPLILAYTPNPVTTTACQSIKLQLNAVGIPITLKRLSPQDTDTNYDLKYVEIAVREPLVDLRRILGPHGLAGRCSSSMSLALNDVDLAKNWKEARSRLQEVHQIAFNDLPMIPLWQTVDHYAYRDSLRGLGDEPVSLYQNVADWQRELRGANR